MSASARLARAQQAFVDVLLERGSAPDGLVGADRGLSAYRNNLAALSARALAVPYERLSAQLGADDFSRLAWTFWRSDPPTCGDLGQWGGGLADFLVRHAGEASGLPDIARLDWALHRAERAADGTLVVASLPLLGECPLDSLWLLLSPAVQLLSQSTGPYLVWREGWRGQHQRLSPGEAQFIEAVLEGDCLDVALQRAQTEAAAPHPSFSDVKGSDPSADFDFTAWLQAALRHAWLLEVSPAPLQGNRSR